MGYKWHIVNPWRDLTAAVVLKAVQDARAGTPTCNGECSSGREGHVCKEDAMTFLRSPGCHGLLEFLSIDVGSISGLVERGRE